MLETYETCSDITQGFRCKRIKMGSRLSYKSVPREVEEIAVKCCDGYRETRDKTCEDPICDPPCKRGQCIAPNKCLCNDGFGGDTCSTRCPFGNWGKNCANRYSLLHFKIYLESYICMNTIFLSCQCNGAGCNPENGECKCPEGQAGLRCEISCSDTSTWGLNCSQPCLCKNGGTCDPVSSSLICKNVSFY